MELKTSIKNNNLANYLMFKLDKIENSFTEDELNQITEVVINYDDGDISLKELLSLKKLNTITLRNGYISSEEFIALLKLKELSSICFENCEFDEEEMINNLKLKSLSLINCNIGDYSFINNDINLEELSIVNGNVNMSVINNLKHLTYLQLSYSNILDNTPLNISSIEELYIDNTNINDFSFIHNLSNLKRISVDKKQYEKNKELFNLLSKNNILVLNENMVTFGGE